MRIWFSGPRILGGLIRPGISFGLSRGQTFARPPATDFVYVIAGDHGLVKVGMTTNPSARLATLQTGSPHRLWLATTVPTFGNAFTIEQAAHQILDAHRMSGEWFAVSPEMAVAAVYGAADRNGISLREPELPEEKKPWKFWPESSIGQIFWVIIILVFIGSFFR